MSVFVQKQSIGCCVVVTVQVIDMVAHLVVTLCMFKCEGKLEKRIHRQEDGESGHRPDVYQLKTSPPVLRTGSMVAPAAKASGT